MNWEADNMGSREADIQKAILDYLRLNRVFCWRNNTGAFAGEYKGKKRFVRFGFPGIADIIGIRQRSPGATGQLFAIEVKGPAGKPTADQEAFLWMVRESGGLSGVCRSVEDAKKLLGL